MLIIRLARFGKKKHSLFRVIISEKLRDTRGSYLELLGNYNPHTNKAVLKDERIKYWLSKGAQTSGTIHNLLLDHKIIEGKKIKVANIKKKPEEKKEASAPAKPAATEVKPEPKKEEPKAETKPAEKKEEKPVEAKPAVEKK
ncbi:MAG: 30S ribosomal protein S16 [Patescibacteria group bacterium]|jgi:small subunit ribosomal protein S16